MYGFVLSQSIYCFLPHQNKSSQWSYSWDIEISEYWYGQPSNIYFKFVSRIFLYFWLIALLAIALTLVYMEHAFFSKAGVLRNNATHSLQMFMLFRTNYIYFCLLFTICIVPRLLENVILLSPLIKWHYSKSYSWCLGSFCMLWTGLKGKTSPGSWNPNLVYVVTEVEKVVFGSYFLRSTCHKMSPIEFYFQEIRKKNSHISIKITLIGQSVTEFLSTLLDPLDVPGVHTWKTLMSYTVSNRFINFSRT